MEIYFFCQKIQIPNRLGSAWIWEVAVRYISKPDASNAYYRHTTSKLHLKHDIPTAAEQALSASLLLPETNTMAIHEIFEELGPAPGPITSQTDLPFQTIGEGAWHKGGSQHCI